MNVVPTLNTQTLRHLPPGDPVFPGFCVGSPVIGGRDPVGSPVIGGLDPVGPVIGGLDPGGPVIGGLDPPSS